MAELSMNQVIHAAVRRDVARTEQALRAFPDGDSGRARELQTAWRNLVRELTHHHEAEDEHVWPYLQSCGVDGSLLAQMESEHVQLKSALAGVSAALDDLVRTPTAAVAASGAEEVARARAVINGHLDHEEADVEPLLAAREEDVAWKAVAKRLRPPSIVDGANAIAWMMDGAGERERTSLRATIPGPVVTVLTGLFARRYRREVAPVWSR
ncbi:MAG TPA: hemerythrin domain-containing protein [Nakamurella sp.]|nr:hemerythrin domain-containing protein [Nakamurella sp.]